MFLLLAISSEYLYIGSCVVAFGYPLYDQIETEIYTMDASLEQNSNRDLHYECITCTK